QDVRDDQYGGRDWSKLVSENAVLEGTYDGELMQSLSEDEVCIEPMDFKQKAQDRDAGCNAGFPNRPPAPVTLIPRPCQLKRDVLSYLRTSPLAAKVRLGSATSEPIFGLTDPDSNVGLIDEEVMRTFYPDITIRSDVVNDVQGMGSKKTLGYAIIPIWVDV